MALDSRTLSPAQRYALVLVDLSVGFTDPSCSPLAAECAAVVEANRRLLEAFRRRGWPVFFTTVAYEDPSQARVFRSKLPVLNVLESGSPLVRIDPRLAPLEHEPVLVKHWASGFFGTDLARRIHASGADGVMVTGLTTSGCVRATALDALQHELRVLVPEEAVGDRDAEAHRANLRDLQIKYADVASLEQCLALLA
ncbi:isochorismatase family protein [Pseudomonas sp. SCB32]|uniref:isochorismatase family protein n=1 Tax=Pseudomonas sp. SCB32 TaxID=2653853 RepID=UPI00126506E2|nr:isochorismatase family protein [Pseudomonas sp. SCB32]